MTFGTIRVEIGYRCNNCNHHFVEEETVWTERHRYKPGNHEAACRNCGDYDTDRTVKFLRVKRAGDHVVTEGGE